MTKSISLALVSSSLILAGCFRSHSQTTERHTGGGHGGGHALTGFHGGSGGKSGGHVSSRSGGFGSTGHAVGG
jgi:hypothetical protein